MTNEEADARLYALAKMVEAEFGLNAPMIIGFSPEDGGFHIACRLTGAQLAMLAYDLIERALEAVKPEYRDAPEVVAMMTAATLLKGVTDAKIEVYRMSMN